MRSKFLRFALSGALVTAACGGSEDSATQPTLGKVEGGAPGPAQEHDAGRVLTGPAAELEGRYFVLVSAEGFAPVPGKEIHVAFENGHVDANASCNGLYGPYRIDGAQLVLERWSTTSLGCFGALGVQDNWYQMFIASKPELSLSGSKLVLRNAEATLHYRDREVANPDRPLVDTLWTVAAFIEGGGVSSGFGSVSVEKATLRLASDGSVRVSTGCNQGQGRYRVDGDHITLSELAYTEEGCALPLLEDKLQSVLSDGALQFAIESQGLTLTRGSIGLLLDAP